MFPTDMTRRLRRNVAFWQFFALAVISTCLLPALLHAQAPVVVSHVAAIPASSDLGVASASAPVDAVVTLKRSDAQQADLNTFLADLNTAGSPSFHKWLTPSQFADRFQPSSDQVEQFRTWLMNQGLTVDPADASRLTLHIHGPVQQVNGAFTAHMHAVRVSDKDSVASASDVTVPQTFAATVKAVRGLDLSVPATADTALDTLAAAVSANTDSVITVGDDTACSGADATALAAQYTPLLEQAAAQGQTVIVTGSCVAQALSPAAQALVIAVQSASATDPTSLAADGTVRPSWQVANGLPTVQVRAMPDVQGDASALATAMNTIVSQASSRQGAAAGTLYTLAPENGIFSNSGDWETGSGLGTVDTQALIKAWPHGTSPNSVSISSSTFSPPHGVLFNLTGTVAPNGGATVPTGTIIFNSTQGGNLASAVTLDANGKATTTVNTNTLAAGVYTFTAQYSGDSTYAAGNSGTATVTVQPEETSKSAVVGAATLGANFNVAVTIKSASGVGTPAGTATVAPQGTSSTTVYSAPLTSSAQGTATSNVSVLATQTGAVTLLVGCTSSDLSFVCNTPISVQVTVGKANPTVTLAYMPGAISNLRSLVAHAATATGTGNLTAKVASPTGVTTTPSGTINFFDGTTPVGTATLDSTGTGTASVTLGSGTHSLTAQYVGDTSFATAISNVVSASGSLIGTSTSLTSTSYSNVFGTSLTLNSTVTPSSTTTLTPGGTITFTDSLDGNLGSVPVLGSVAALGTSNLSVGQHTIVATYSGDGNFAASASTSTVVITISPLNGGLQAMLVPSTIGYGTNAVVNVILTGPAAAATGPTVQAVVNNNTYTANVNAGQATIVVNAPPPGTYPVTISCGTSKNLNCSNTVSQTLHVVPGGTTTTIIVTPNVPTAGATTTVTANVVPTTAPTYTVAAITGIVVVTDNGVAVGSGAVTNGVASVHIILTGGKSHNIVATYGGDANWAASASQATSVLPSSVDPVIVLSANTLSSLAGATVTFTATVSAHTGIVSIPTGTVTFYDTAGGTTRQLGSAALISDGISQGVATFTTAALISGTNSVYAVYVGDGTFNKLQSTQLLLTTGDFRLTLNPPSAVVTKGGSISATALLSMSGGFTGTVSLGCVPPAGFASACSFSPNQLTAGGTSTLTITTSTTSSSHLDRGSRSGWAAGASLAMLLFFALPGRRRFANLLLIALVAGLSVAAVGCADGTVQSSSGSGSGTTSTPMGTGTPLGTNNFTITAAATDGVTTVRHSYSFQVTVQ